ncbi:MAG: ribose 5-phosphate isomerase B [Anaerolineaceae bacterium]|nr:ribose 5-phosphate isomerase B [Anaerolineaceae bacterium]
MNKEEIEQLQEVVRKVVSSQMQHREKQPLAAVNTNNAQQQQSIAIGADHGGFSMKAALIPYLEELGYQVIDCGTYNTDSVDYPDFAYAVAKHVSEGTAWRGIMIDGAGIGSCMTANKVKGVRAAMCYDYATASNSREHNAANMLTMGSGLIGLNQAKLIVKTWLTTEYAGGRHQNRIDKIMQIEQLYFKDGK